MPYQRVHGPFYGYMRGGRHTIPLHLVHYARTFSILRLLNRIRFKTVLNVGGAEGYQSSLLERLFGVRTVTIDLMRDWIRDASFPD